jgi:hypothetical protein
VNAVDPLGTDIEGSPEGYLSNIGGDGSWLPVTEEGNAGGGDDRTDATATASASTAESIKSNLAKLDRGLREPNVVVHSENELLEFLDQNTVGGKIVVDEGEAGQGRLMFQLPDGTTVQFREYSGSHPEPTVDIQFGGAGKIVKVHVDDEQ